MTILENQFEAVSEPIQGSFFDTGVIDVTGCEAQKGLEFVRFADTERLCASISETAVCLSQSDLHPLFRGIEQRSLNEKLEELKDELKHASAIEIEFSHKMTMYTDAYDDLLAVYGQQTDLADVHRVVIPGKNVHAVTALAGQESESFFWPRAILRVSTGFEKPLSVIRDGKVVEDEGQPRWFDFPLSRSRIVTLGLPTK